MLTPYYIFIAELFIIEVKLCLSLATIFNYQVSIDFLTKDIKK